MSGVNNRLQPPGHALHQLLKVHWGHHLHEGDDPSVLDGLLQLQDGVSLGVLFLQLVLPS